jgi:GNAT superfamily N-acetyltransferase
MSDAPTQLAVRPAEPADAPALTEIAHAAKRHWRYPESWIAAWGDVLTVTADYLARHLVLVAESGDRAVGFVALEDHGAYWEIGHLWVLPSAMGRGIGRRLFQQAAAEAAHRRPGVLRIESDPNARSFYERMGARLVGEVPRPVEETERVLPVLEMWVERLASSV